MLVETLSTSFRKARSVNETSNGYVAKIPTKTEPTGDAATATGASVIDLGKGGLVGQNIVLICPYAIGSNNNTFSLRVIGWRVTGENDAGTLVWIPVPLAELACTISSTCLGLTGRAIIATEFFADTITITGTTANAGAAVNVNSPANDTLAYAAVDVFGFQKIELQFTTGGSATSCNALLALL